MSNPFFKNNIVKPLQRSSSYSDHQFCQTARTTSTLNPKLDAKKFVHREVFNNQLYQTGKEKNMKKYFQISVSKQERDLGKLGEEQGKFLKQVNGLLQGGYISQKQKLIKPWNSLFHYVSIIENLIRYTEQKDPFRIAITSMLQCLEEFVSKAEKQFTFQDRRIKEWEANLNGNKRLKLESTEKQQMLIHSKFENNNISTFSNTHMLGSLTSRKFNEEPTNKTKDENMMKKWKAKANHIEFQNNKLILMVQKLKSDLKQTNDKLKDVELQNERLSKDQENIEKQRQGFEYKIRKLKEELEVAHIVKEQNLGDKIDYILGWKL